jgi:hypothetical protein
LGTLKTIILALTALWAAAYGAVPAGGVLSVGLEIDRLHALPVVSIVVEGGGFANVLSQIESGCGLVIEPVGRGFDVGLYMGARGSPVEMLRYLQDSNIAFFSYGDGVWRAHPPSFPFQRIYRIAGAKKDRIEKAKAALVALLAADRSASVSYSGGDTVLTVTANLAFHARTVGLIEFVGSWIETTTPLPSVRPPAREEMSAVAWSPSEGTR